MQFYVNFIFLIGTTPTKSAALTLHIFILRNLHSMTVIIARTYAQLLSWSCNTRNKFLKHILDSVSEFNGYYIGGKMA